MKKKLIALCLIVVMIAVAAIGGTLAYFTDSKTATNTFTMGSVKIELTEDSWRIPENVVPGVSYAKDPVVKNIGKNDAWIRVDIILSDAAAFEAAAAKIGGVGNLGLMFADLNKDNKWEAIASETKTGDVRVFSFYYKEVLEAGKSTDALFSAVKIPGAFTNADMAALGDDFTITIQAHAIQTAEDYTTVADAFAKYGA